jgi:hypothetical protein
MTTHKTKKLGFAALALLACSAAICLAAGGSAFVGQLDLVEQYAPGVGASGPICYVGVAASQVQNKASCAPVASRYYYAWDCDDPRRKNFLALATAAYMSERKVQLLGTGQCSPHPIYENLDYFVISDSP